MKCGANLTGSPSGKAIPLTPQGTTRQPPATSTGGGIGRVIKWGLMGIGALVVFVIFCIFVAAFVYGGTGSTAHPVSASVSGAVTGTTIAAHTTISTLSNPADFSQVTHLSVLTMKSHWGSGADYDGILISPDLKDSSDTSIHWSGATLPVDIQIYSTKFDSNYKEVKDKLVYQGTGHISSWKDGNPYMGGIQVPFSSMQVPAGETYGWAVVTVHLPDGKTYADTDQVTPLTP